MAAASPGEASWGSGASVDQIDPTLAFGWVRCPYPVGPYQAQRLRGAFQGAEACLGVGACQGEVLPFLEAAVDLASGVHQTSCHRAQDLLGVC